MDENNLRKTSHATEQYAVVMLEYSEILVIIIILLNVA